MNARVQCPDAVADQCQSAGFFAAAGNDDVDVRSEPDSVAGVFEADRRVDHAADQRGSRQFLDRNPRVGRQQFAAAEGFEDQTTSVFL